MKQTIKLTESELREMIVNTINESMEEGFWGDLAHKGTNAARRFGRKAEKFGNKIDDFNTNVANGVKQGAQTVGNTVKQGAQAVGDAAKQGAQAVKKGVQNVKQGANDWASLNKRVTAIEQQLGMNRAVAESIENVVDKVLNEMINNK